MSDAHEAIRNLLGTYCELMDAGAWAEVGQLFADAELVGPDDAVVARGAEAVQALYERGTRLHDDSPRTRHVTANTVIEISGGHATARSAYVVFQGVAAFPLQPVITGRYRDEFVREAEGWRFARRQFFVDHLGDLSHHLTYEMGSR
jgi:3-phenylpropionate/cinnamic acid dioxygenase small subunit